MMPRSLRRTVLALAVSAGLAAPAPAARIEGVDFADRVEGMGRPLELHAVGLLRYRLVFKAYVAALYLEPARTAAQVLEDVPKRLEIEYFWAIRGRDFGRAADELLEQSLAPADLAALRSRIDRFHALYRDVEPGDRYALHYHPGIGTELSLNGEPLGLVPGADFARAYFGIWLGSDPLDESLRRQLLDGS